MEDNVVSGDLFISIDRVSENAVQEGVSKSNELARVIIHGLLHLCGYNDKEEKDKRMFPITDSSSTVADCFLQEAKKLKIEIFINYNSNYIM